jgi:hypothetical protein
LADKDFLRLDAHEDGDASPEVRADVVDAGPEAHIMSDIVDRSRSAVKRVYDRGADRTTAGGPDSQSYTDSWKRTM